MSKDVNSYRPTSYSSKTNLGEPMATRGVIVSTNTDDDSNDQSDDQRVVDVDTFLKENPLSYEIYGLIRRLPSMCSRLTSPESYDSLKLNEFLTLAIALKINVNQSGTISIKSRRNRDRSVQTKAQILASIAEKFGEQWTTLYDIAKDMQNSSKSPRHRKQNKISMNNNFGFDITESKLNGCLSEINKAISHIQTSVKLPTRDELIFLTDEEYEEAIRFYRATHPEIIDINKLPRGNGITTQQLLLGVSRETTEALRSCFQQATIIKKFIDAINENQLAKNGTSQDFHNNFTNQPETDSSEEHP